MWTYCSWASGALITWAPSDFLMHNRVWFIDFLSRISVYWLIISAQVCRARLPKSQSRLFLCVSHNLTLRPPSHVGQLIGIDFWLCTFLELLRCCCLLRLVMACGGLIFNSDSIFRSLLSIFLLWLWVIIHVSLCFFRHFLFLICSCNFKRLIECWARIYIRLLHGISSCIFGYIIIRALRIRLRSRFSIWSIRI